MNAILRLTFSTLAFGLVANTAIADCGGDSDNLLQGNNCDFASDPAANNGWYDASVGTLSHNAGAGFPTAGSGQVAGEDLGGFFAGTLQAYGTTSHPTCVNVAWDGSDSDATAGVYVRQVSGSSSCTVTVSFRPGAGMPLSPCGGAPIDACTSGAIAPDGSWQLLSCEVNSVGSAATGIVFSSTCQDSSAFEVGFDNAFVRPGTGQMPVELEYFSVED